MKDLDDLGALVLDLGAAFLRCFFELAMPPSIALFQWNNNKMNREE
jgi:hypothetical protein